MIAKSWFSRCWQWEIGGCVALMGALSVGISERVLAQILPDKTLGAEGSVVTPNVNIKGTPSDRIDGGATRGANLFHSFGKFNVGEGRGVYFANPAGIENILTRVTGNNPSNILGRLGVLGGANLFLLNPHGIVFGPNASLDIQGSFVATTAERIHLGDSGYFSATQPQTSSLLSVTPGALFFSQVANQPTAIINQGNLSTGKHLTLSAGNLDLQGQLQAGGDLKLQAQDTVKVRDSAVIPFIASAGGNLLVQGNQKVDIFALTDPESGFFSGRDMVLRSTNTVEGDAHYWSGGNFRIEQLDGSLGNLFSPHDPIFRARGDVYIFVYEGASLHILAGGKVEIPGYVSIQGADPENGLVETVNLADGTTISINGKSEPTLDIRAGVNPDVVGKSILSLTGTGTFIEPAYATSNQSSADIRIGTILFADAASKPLEGRLSSQPLAGRVLLTNQYQPNSSLSGDIKVTQTIFPQNIQGSWGAISMDGGAGNPSFTINSRGSIILHGTVNTYSSFRNGGAITLNAAKGSITTGDLNSYSSFGDGGAITLNAAKGSITTGDLNTYSSFGDGGAITLNAAKDSITTGDLNSYSYTAGNPSSSAYGDGGAITLNAAKDIIITGDLDSHTYYQYSADPRKGGAITLTASNGSINTGNLLSWSNAFGDTGNGGAISLTASNGSINTLDFDSSSYSRHSDTGNGGAISLTASNGKIYTGDFNSGTSSIDGSAKAGGAISLSTSNGSIKTGSFNSGTYSPMFGSTENGGAISLSTSNGSINTGSFNSSSSAATNNSEGNGGNISLNTSNGSIKTGDFNTSSSSIGGSTENGGNISLVSTNGSINTGDLNTSSSSSVYDADLAGNGGAINLHATNNINITGDLNTSSFSIYPAGNGGAISLDATNGRITISPDNESSRSINASGNSGGNISLTSPAGIFELKDGLISSNATANGSGGNIQIAAASVSLANTDLTTTTRGMGNAGSISMTVDGLVELDKSRLFTSLEPGGVGRGGDITIDAGTVSLTNFSFIDTATFGKGNAGNASLKVDDSVSLDNTSAIFSITADQGDGGNVNVKAGGVISLSNRSNISTAVNEGAEGNGGDIDITARSLSQTGSSQLVTSTSGSGNAGKITVNTTEGVIISGVDPNFIAPQPLNVSEGNPPRLDEVKSNGSIAQAQPLTQFFLNSSNDVNPNVEFSTRIPYVSIANNISDHDSSDSGHYYSFKVTAAGTRAIFDMDTPNKSGASKSLVLLDSNGNQLESNSGASFSLGAGGSTSESNDPYLRYAFSEPSTYYIQVKSENTSILQVSLETPNAATSVVNKTLPSGLFARTQGTGLAGNVTINTPHLTITDRGNVSATATATATSTTRGGNIEVNASQVNLQGNKSGIFAQTEGDATAGSLTLQPYNNGQSLTVNLQDNPQISASTSSSGQGGNLFVTAPQTVTIKGNGQLSVETSSAGGAGNVMINTPQLTVTDGGNVSATATAAAATTAQGGNIEVNSSQVNLSDNNSGLFAQTQGAAPAGSLTLQPYNNGQSLTVNLQENPQISASTSSSGQGGNLFVTAPQAVTIKGNGQLSVETSGAGGAGNVMINTPQLTVTDGGNVSATATAAAATTAQGGNIEVNSSQVNLSDNNSGLFAQTQGAAPAGSLTLNPDNNGQSLTVNLQDNAQISASTSSSGQGGNLLVTAPQAVTIKGNGQLLVETSGAGVAGNLTIATQRLTIQDEAQVSASTSSPSSPAKGGNITVIATQSLDLNQASLLAQSTNAAPAGKVTINTANLTARNGMIATSSNQSSGGDITITADQIHLFGNSDITTFVAQGAGGGGDIKLTADSIVAFDDSDILAYAPKGTGGNITFETPAF
ncbi:MAG: filamentous hemagglutinin N-terminal domain-containing protein, partial [Nostoc sp.]|uniref:two-partner secretion domain-containing protein n=1 Tax=Nostoc sp. TaxID=1180 RepID=UPI002FF7F729